MTKINGELVKTFYKCEHHRVLNETLPLRWVLFAAFEIACDRERRRESETALEIGRRRKKDISDLLARSTTGMTRGSVTKPVTFVNTSLVIMMGS